VADCREGRSRGIGSKIVIRYEGVAMKTVKDWTGPSVSNVSEGYLPLR
jgi:hypothetical protein